MLNRKMKTAIITALALVMGCSMPVTAAGTGYSTTIGGTKTTTFDTYLVMDAEAEVPNASFTYTVTAGAAKAYNVDGKTFEILPGVDANKVSVVGVTGDGASTANSVTYKVGNTTAQDDNAYVKDYDKSVQKYAKKTVNLSFSSCKFTEPGVYRYVITQSGTNLGVTNDAGARYVDVYVEDDSTSTQKKLSITGYVLHSNGDDAPAASATGGTSGSYASMKSQGFTNQYDTSNLTFRKKVTGNQGSRDKYFEFTVKLTGAAAGTKYNVVLDKADTTSGTNAATIAANAGKTNVAEMTAGADGTVTQKFYLQHNQEITVQGIADGTRYEVTENAEDYVSTAAKVGGYNDPASGTINKIDLQTSYQNARNGVIPTGVIVAVAPFAAATLAGGVGAVVIVAKKRKEDRD